MKSSTMAFWVIAQPRQLRALESTLIWSRSFLAMSELGQQLAELRHASHQHDLQSRPRIGRSPQLHAAPSFLRRRIIRFPPRREADPAPRSCRSAGWEGGNLRRALAEVQRRLCGEATARLLPPSSFGSLGSRTLEICPEKGRAAPPKPSGGPKALAGSEERAGWKGSASVAILLPLRAPLTLVNNKTYRVAVLFCRPVNFLTSSRADLTQPAAKAGRSDGW